METRPVPPPSQYGNNCNCADHCSVESCYAADVNATVGYGFDSTKLDGCGAELDLTLWASLFNASGRVIMIENCHWGGTGESTGVRLEWARHFLLLLRPPSTSLGLSRSLSRGVSVAICRSLIFSIALSLASMSCAVALAPTTTTLRAIALAVPNSTWCPWDYFRSSGDIEASYYSMMSNAATTKQWAFAGLSRPGCWA